MEDVQNTAISSGAAQNFEYLIPMDHMGGTAWYHPHKHGSTFIHAGGGAAGLVIVKVGWGSPHQLLVCIDSSAL